MRVMVIVKASKESEAGVLADEKMMTEMKKFNDELLKAGMLLAAGEGLQASSKGVRVGFSGDERPVVAGPFAATKELAADSGSGRCNRSTRPSSGQSVVQCRMGQSWRFARCLKRPILVAEAVAKE